MKVYLVLGETGEYSDHYEWRVCVYEEKAHAEEHAKRAKAFADQYRQEHPHTHQPTKGVNPWDSNMHLDYTGTEYSVEELELHQHFDQVLEELEQRGIV